MVRQGPVAELARIVGAPAVRRAHRRNAARVVAASIYCGKRERERDVKRGARRPSEHGGSGGERVASPRLVNRQPAECGDPSDRVHGSCPG